MATAVQETKKHAVEIVELFNEWQDRYHKAVEHGALSDVATAFFVVAAIKSAVIKSDVTELHVQFYTHANLCGG